MFTRILTRRERRLVARFKRENGSRNSAVRQLVSRARKNMNRITRDMQLLQELLAEYEKERLR